MGELNMTWEQYLAGIGGRSPEGRIAGIVWNAAKVAVGQRGRVLPVPRASYDDGLADDASRASLSWDLAQHHVDIEILNGGALDWFYMNRSSRETDGTDDPVAAAPLPDALIDRLCLVSPEALRT